MAKILLLYSTTDGHTLTISRRLADVIGGQGHEVALVDLDGVGTVDLAPYDKILIGARIRYGRHTPQLYRFIERHRAALEAKPAGFFSVSVVARKPGKNTPETNPYMRKFLRRSRWRPRHLAVFAGRIDYPHYGAVDRLIIRFIMWLTHGPTAPDAVVEFTDWQAVDAFGLRIAGE